MDDNNNNNANIIQTKLDFLDENFLSKKCTISSFEIENDDNIKFIAGFSSN
jgi:hypothetical protein